MTLAKIRQNLAMHNTSDSEKRLIRQRADLEADSTRYILASVPKRRSRTISDSGEIDFRVLDLETSRTGETESTTRENINQGRASNTLSL